MFVLKCLRGQEAKVKDKLENLYQCEVLAPYLFKKGKGDDRYFYPGFLFVRFNSKEVQLEEVLNELRKDFRLSWRTDPSGQLLNLTPAEKETILSLCAESVSSVYKEGDKVRVIDGLFNGREGTVLAVNNQTSMLRLSIQLLNSEVKTWVAFSQVLLD